MSSLSEAIAEARRMSHGNGTATVETAKWLRILTALLRAERIEAAATLIARQEGLSVRTLEQLKAALSEEP